MVGLQINCVEWKEINFVIGEAVWILNQVGVKQVKLLLKLERRGGP